MSIPDAKIIYLTAGAGGMFCGSCMHDNALSKALASHGWNIQLVPTYTPIRTDEDDVSVDQVLFGGINVYLQQKIPLLKYLPGFLDRFLDSPWLIRKVTSRAVETDARMLGKLAFSMLKGAQGNQVREVKKLCKWIELSNAKLLIFSNILIGGCIEEIKRKVSIPVLVTLQGDDVFLDSLQSPYREQCITRIKELVRFVDGFIVQSEFFRDYMSDYFSIPRQKFHVTPLGIDVKDFLELNPPTPEPSRKSIGYLARLAPEKGLHHLVDAFIEMKNREPAQAIQLRIAGWLSPENKEYVQRQWSRLEDAGLGDQFEYLGSVGRSQKLEFLQQIDVLSVPTEFLEPKGIYALEAMAAGIPVVVPEHGAFPELVRSTGGGWLVPPKNAAALAAKLIEVLQDDEARTNKGQAGREHVIHFRNAKSMAEATSQVIQSYL